MAADKINLMCKRLKAVLTYDGVAQENMHTHLAKTLQVSKPAAKRMLVGKSHIFLQKPTEVTKALDIKCEWLYFGEFWSFHNRTMRIHMQAYKCYPKEIADKAMRFNFAVMAGQAKALNLLNLISCNKLNYLDALAIHQPH